MMRRIIDEFAYLASHDHVEPLIKISAPAEFLNSYYTEIVKSALADDDQTIEANAQILVKSLPRISGVPSARHRLFSNLPGSLIAHLRIDHNHNFIHIPHEQKNRR
jgi:light-regulated signal transduction histidine kinase (bacteriophytochrome)